MAELSQQANGTPVNVCCVLGKRPVVCSLCSLFTGRCCATSHVWHCVGDWAARRPLAACGQRVHVVCAVNRACCAAIYTVFAVHVWSLVFDPHKKLHLQKEVCL